MMARRPATLALLLLGLLGQLLCRFLVKTLDEALDFATRVRIIEGFSSEISPVREFGLTMHEGAAILGEASVYADGSWEAAVPARLPYHLQPLDRYGMAIRNQMLWIQAMPGEERRCGGCHEDRTGQVLPRTGPTTLAQQAGAQGDQHAAAFGAGSRELVAEGTVVFDWLSRSGFSSGDPIASTPEFNKKITWLIRTLVLPLPAGATTLAGPRLCCMDVN